VFVIVWAPVQLLANLRGRRMASVLDSFYFRAFVVGIFVYGFFTLLQRLLAFRKQLGCFRRIPLGTKTYHWFWGSIHEFPGLNEKGLAWMVDRAASIKEGYAVGWFGPFVPTLNLFHPNSVKAILKTSEPKPLSFGPYSYIHPWLGEGLLLTGGKKWYRNRRLLTPAFHFDILRPYVEVNNRCTDIFLNKLEEFSEQNKYFEVFTNISQLTLDVILRCAFRYENDCQVKGNSHPYMQAVNSLSDAASYRLFRPWLYPSFVYNLSPTGRKFKENCDFVHEISEEIIRTRREALSEANDELCKTNKYLDFLDILLTAKDENGQGLTDREIRDEADTFLFEGHDTTASGISWTLYSLAKHPEHQRTCQQEVDEIFRNKKSEDIEWDDLPKLKHLTMCIKEALRLHTPVPAIQRQTTQDMTIDGHQIPAGSLLLIQLYILHHIPSVWKDPDEYRPERFAPENQSENDEFAFIPFSAGPRNCIGQNFAMHEMKTIIARTLRRSVLHTVKLARATTSNK
jgi:cytochrome P450